MILPKELAQALIEHIDLAYLKYNERSGDKESYLSHVEYHMDNAFNIEWGKGGTYGTCWSDELSEVAGDDEPSMTQLDDFLSKYYPNLTEDQRYEVYSCVKEDETSDSDWYGGSTSKGHKSLSFKDLADCLVKEVYNNVDNDSLELIDFNELVEQHSGLVINMFLADYPKLNLFKDLSENLDSSNSNTRKMKI